MDIDTDTDLFDTINHHWLSSDVQTDCDPLPMIGRLLRISKKIEISAGKLHKSFGLQPGEFDVLATLKHQAADSLTPSQLYQAMLLSSGAMTSRLDRLELKGLIQRQHCKHDRRRINVSLTHKGHEIIELVYPAHIQLLNALLTIQSAADKQQLANLLKQWLFTLEVKGSLST